MANDPLAAKRKLLYNLIAAKRKARQLAVTSYAELDLNEVATAFNGPEGDQLRRDIENIKDEASLDTLIEHHSPTTARCVW